MEACGRIGVLGFTSMLLCGAFLVGQSKGLKNCSKLPHAISGIFYSISSSNNLVLNIFFWQYNFIESFGEFENFDVLICQYGLSGSEGLKSGQNYQMYDFLAISEHFYFKRLSLNTFSGSTNSWRLLGECEPLDVLIC